MANKYVAMLLVVCIVILHGAEAHPNSGFDICFSNCYNDCVAKTKWSLFKPCCNVKCSGGCRWPTTHARLNSLHDDDASPKYVVTVEEMYEWAKENGVALPPSPPLAMEGGVTNRKMANDVALKKNHLD